MLQAEVMVEAVEVPIPAAPELREADAQGPMKATYEEIKSTLRVPYVDPFFRVLAAESADYLLVAWQALRTNAQTVFFEAQADAIRQAAVEAASGLPALDAFEATDRDRRMLEVLQYAGPKIFLCVAALRAATLGQEPRLQELASIDKCQVSLGVPLGMLDLESEVSSQLDPDARRSIAQMAALTAFPAIPVEWHAFVSASAGLTQAATSAHRLVVEGPAPKARRDLQRLAQQSVSLLPFRLDIGPHTLRHAGLAEQTLDSVRATLATYYACLPVQLVATAALAGRVLGREGAQRSQFPPALASEQSS